MNNWVTQILLLLSVLAAVVSCRTSPTTTQHPVATAIIPLAESRYETMQKISGIRNIPIPDEFHHIMAAALSADWAGVSNGYEQIWRQSHWFESNEEANPRIANELWHPLHETYWTFKYLMEWPEELVKDYCQTILVDIPTNSLVFTGSDAARFLLGSLAPKFGRSDIIFLSQNALADNSYMDYAQDIHGETMWIPDEEQRVEAFRRFVHEVKEGTAKLDHVTNTNGRISMDGLAGVMWINGELARIIAHSNSPPMRIFVDEAYIIPWMTPYLKPHGLLTELKVAPVTNLTPQEVQEDMEYWDRIEKRLAANYDFASPAWSGKAYAMMRTAIAGLYAHHKMYREAETAFRQAMRFAPQYPEPAFRLAVQVLAPQDRRKEAETLLLKLKAAHPENKNYDEYIRKIR